MGKLDKQQACSRCPTIVHALRCMCLPGEMGKTIVDSRCEWLTERYKVVRRYGGRKGVNIGNFIDADATQYDEYCLVKSAIKEIKLLDPK